MLQVSKTQQRAWLNWFKNHPEQAKVEFSSFVMKKKCGICGEIKRVKFYVTADALEYPVLRCKKCVNALKKKAIKKGYEYD